MRERIRYKPWLDSLSISLLESFAKNALNHLDIGREFIKYPNNLHVETFYRNLNACTLTLYCIFYLININTISYLGVKPL